MRYCLELSTLQIYIVFYIFLTKLLEDLKLHFKDSDSFLLSFTKNIYLIFLLKLIIKSQANLLIR